MSAEILMAIGSAVLGGIVWLVRLEAKTNGTSDKQLEVIKSLEKFDTRMEKLELRHDAILTEMRSVMIGIQKSISKIEGKLSIPDN